MADLLYNEDAEVAAAERGIVPGSVIRVKDPYRRNKRTILVTAILSVKPESTFMIVKGRRVMAAFDRPKQFPNGYIVEGHEKVHSWGHNVEIETGVTEHRGISLA